MVVTLPIYRCEECGNHFCQRCLSEWWTAHGKQVEKCCVYNCEKRKGCELLSLNEAAEEGSYAQHDAGYVRVSLQQRRLHGQDQSRRNEISRELMLTCYRWLHQRRLRLSLPAKAITRA